MHRHTLFRSKLCILYSRFYGRCLKNASIQKVVSYYMYTIYILRGVNVVRCCVVRLQCNFYAVLLQTFSRDPAYQRFCLVHLFTHIAFDNGVLGLAYIAGPRSYSVGGICSPRK